MPDTPRRRPEEFGEAVRAHAWERIGLRFEAWATAREEQLRGYRRDQLRGLVRSGYRSMQRQLDAVEQERFDPGSFRSRSSLAAREASLPGGVRHAPRSKPEIGLGFDLGLPTDFLMAHPDAEGAIREGIERACEATGLRLRVISDVRGGSNWVIAGYLDPEPAPEPEPGASFRP